MCAQNNTDCMHTIQLYMSPSIMCAAKHTTSYLLSQVKVTRSWYEYSINAFDMTRLNSVIQL